MKTIFVSLLFIYVSVLPSSATIHYVDNNPNSITTFKTLQEAYNGAANGDTIYLLPSTSTYGLLSPTGAIKKLTILGNGYFLDQNVLPQTQANKGTSIIGQVTFDVGLSGSKLMGINSTGPIIISNASDITIARNYLSYAASSQINITGTSSRRIVISQNYMRATNHGVYYTVGVSNAQDVLLINNCFLSGSTGYAGPVISIGSGITNVSVVNNVIQGKIVGGDASFYNNILIDGPVSGGASYFNNLCNGTQFPSGNGNIQNVNMTTVFQGLTNNSTDGQWRLAAGSPAIGAGYGGVDCGMFGGDFPYVLSGLPPVPNVYSVTVPSQISTGTTSMNVTVKIKANN